MISMLQSVACSRGFNDSQCNINRDIIKKGKYYESRRYVQSISKTTIMVIRKSGRSYRTFWCSQEAFQIASQVAAIFRDSRSWIDFFLFSYSLYLKTLKGFVRTSLASTYMPIYLQGE